MLRARGLSIAPPAQPALEVLADFELMVEPGEWVAIRGENGSGKTSLLLALAGLRPLRAGSLHWKDRAVGPGMDPETRAELAVVLQEPESQLLQPTVAEELAFAPRNLGLPEATIRQRVSRRAAELGLEADLARDPHTLSAGRQQLVLLAAALVQEPRLLLLDEAGAHLDAPARARVIAALGRARARGLAIVWVTQERAEIEAADRIVELAARRPSGPRGGVAVVSADPSPEAPDLASVRIAADQGRAGPRVLAPRPREIRIAARGITAVEGPNGCGKTVFLSAIAGAVELSQVEVRWNRAPTSPPLLAAQYPELQLFEERARDEVVFAALRRGAARATTLGRASGMLERLGFPAAEFLARRCWDLSAGEKRVLLVVATLAAPASLWILDEPTAGLDPGVRGRLAEILCERCRGMAGLVASQDGEWLDRLAARRHVLGSECPEAAGIGQKSD